MTDNDQRTEWPLRPVLLAILGAVAAVIVAQPRRVDPTGSRLAFVAFVAIFTALLAFTL